MAASLKGIDPELKNYLRIHRLTDIYEALLTGISVMCPDDPYQFLVDKLTYLRDYGLDELFWDCFVDESMKPRSRIITDSNLDYVFNLEEHLLPTPEMYAMAYSHYNNSLKTVCFSAWMQYHLRKRMRKLQLQRKMASAAQHHCHQLLRHNLHIWLDWTRYRRGRQAMAFNKIQHVFNVAVSRVIFQAWRNVTLDAKRTREYFEINLTRLERGEHMDEEDAFGHGSGEARDDVSLLPKKVAVLIFGFLDIRDLARCAAVCRSWKVITQYSALWSRLDLSKVRNRVTDKSTNKLLQKCRPYMGHLNLRGCRQLTKLAFTAVSECRNLQDLNLSECYGLNDDAMRLITEGCRILLYFNVSHTSITDASLRCFGKYCKTLQYLSIAYCKRFTDKGLYYLSNGEGCKKLIYLDLSNCTQLNVEGFKYLSEGLTSLQELHLNEFSNLSDESVQLVLDKCVNIKTVSFLGTCNLSDETFKKLALNRKLERLKLENNQRISDSAIKAIGKNCHDLRQIYMVDCQRVTDLALKALSMCRNLTVINLADCIRITDTGVRHIVESSCGPKIREMNLTNCIRVGDIALVNIHKRCHSLTYLSVCYCEHISEAGIELLGQTHSLTSVDLSGCNCGDQALSSLGNNLRFKDVTLAECTSITDLGLQKFAQQCREIERLDLSHCAQLTDGAIKNLAFCCRMINVLSLAGCKLLTDLSIQYLSGVCHYLISLDLSGCVLVTDKSMKYLRKGCKKLRMLSIMYCRGITKSTAHKLMRHIEQVDYNSDDVPSYFGY
ncbi:F-box and leucine-rich repeat protein 13-like isoform X2 [Tubulanus polymorphus]|uniref:F-box and leucine-rich repeat protein 13-like isoform X2 n=1 Tax=Tubulanus polymorphus TaxID=672921 RepID=UPI003DA2DF65